MLLKFENVLKIVESTLLLELKPEPELEQKPVKKKRPAPQYWLFGTALSQIISSIVWLSLRIFFLHLHYVKFVYCRSLAEKSAAEFFDRQFFLLQKLSVEII